MYAPPEVPTGTLTYPSPPPPSPDRTLPPLHSTPQLPPLPHHYPHCPLPTAPVRPSLTAHVAGAQVRGAIVNISSVAAHGGAPFIMPYSVSKAALNCMTKNNAAELAPKGIRVNAINMGWTYTENEDKLRSGRACLLDGPQSGGGD